MDDRATRFRRAAEQIGCRPRVVDRLIGFDRAAIGHAAELGELAIDRELFLTITGLPYDQDVYFNMWSAALDIMLDPVEPT